MKLARKPRKIGDIDVTSFSDLAFLLIIFFVLTTTFSRPMGVGITIPSRTSDPEKKSSEEVPTINVSKDVVLLNKDEVTMVELRRKLVDLKLPERVEAQRIVILESAADVPYQRYFEIVTAVAHAGGILALVETVEEGKSP
jgi:biopolymer transport protein ExbD